MPPSLLPMPDQRLTHATKPSPMPPSLLPHLGFQFVVDAGFVIWFWVGMVCGGPLVVDGRWDNSLEFMLQEQDPPPPPMK
ncbi:hypothetical protein SO802_002276 [Lithocarpus litseifolius]|uniref:Transmembrane protein n=1 Tax=Lithocarpus litseifolius TaxID=425828 RepID=A0AAW2DXA9_9ROSI